MLPPGIVQVYEGSSVTLNWSYSLAFGLVLGGIIRFNGDGIVFIRSDGQVGAVYANFQERLNVSSTLGRTSLFIFNVNVADDKANGEFSCVLIDSNFNNWKRAIQVQVIGKLQGATNQERQYLREPDWHFFNFSEWVCVT